MLGDHIDQLFPIAGTKGGSMKNRKLGSVGRGVVVTALLAMAGGSALAADGSPMTPELAAKKEMVRKQEEQRVTPAKRKAAAEALKAERLKVYQAREAARKENPGGSENK
jgi:hypothetical protein